MAIASQESRLYARIGFVQLVVLRLHDQHCRCGARNKSRAGRWCARDHATNLAHLDGYHDRHRQVTDTCQVEAYRFALDQSLLRCSDTDSHQVVVHDCSGDARIRQNRVRHGTQFESEGLRGFVQFVVDELEDEFPAGLQGREGQLSLATNVVAACRSSAVPGLPQEIDGTVGRIVQFHHEYDLAIAFACIGIGDAHACKVRFRNRYGNRGGRQLVVVAAAHGMLDGDRGFYQSIVVGRSAHCDGAGRVPVDVSEHQRPRAQHELRLTGGRHDYGHRLGGRGPQDHRIVRRLPLLDHEVLRRDPHLAQIVVDDGARGHRSGLAVLGIAHLHREGLVRFAVRVVDDWYAHNERARKTWRERRDTRSSFVVFTREGVPILRLPPDRDFLTARQAQIDLEGHLGIVLVRQPVADLDHWLVQTVLDHNRGA